MAVQKNSFIYLNLFVMFIIGVVSGFLLGKTISSKTTTTSPVVKVETNKLFTSQYALITGKVTGVNGRSVTVQNSQNSTGTFELSSNFYLIPLSKGNELSTPSTDSKKIEINKDVAITLEPEGGTYKIKTIQYIQPSAQISPLPLPHK